MSDAPFGAPSGLLQRLRDLVEFTGGRETQAALEQVDGNPDGYEKRGQGRNHEDEDQLIAKQMVAKKMVAKQMHVIAP